MSPGLIYDEISYVQFLCHEGYTGSSMAALIGSKSINFSAFFPGLGADALNYPNMQLSLKNHQEPTVGVFRRTVTNVGPPQSIYNATVRAPKVVEITLEPMSLSFSRALQKRSFKVVVKANPAASMEVRSGLNMWKSSKHLVGALLLFIAQKTNASILCECVYASLLYNILSTPYTYHIVVNCIGIIKVAKDKRRSNYNCVLVFVAIDGFQVI